MTIIDQILKKYKLPRSMAVRPDDNTGWLVPFAMDAEAMCGPNAVASGAQFAFIEGYEMQAVAIQDENGEIFGMYAGMFWMLCRLASSIAGSGIFPAMEGGEEPSWAPDLTKSLRTPRELLDEKTPFDWQLEAAGWKQHPQRQMLFYVVLSILVRFVLLHEVGHLHHDHGRRRPASAMVVDQVAPSLLEPSEAIPSQAREILADTFALSALVKILDRELSEKAGLEMTKIIREKLMPDQAALVQFVITVVYLYFRLSDRSDWEALPIDRLSHPPAPFRMKALFAALLEDPPLDLTEREAAKAVQAASYAGDAVMSVVLGIFPKPFWFETISGPDHDRHFVRIYEEFPNWYGPI